MTDSTRSTYRNCITSLPRALTPSIHIIDTLMDVICFFFFSSRRRHTRYWRDWSSDVCSSDLAFSPEREDPGRRDHSTQTIPKLVGGIDPVSGELATALYRKAIKQVIPVSSAEVAEAAKILENTYRAVNIALVNELKVVLQAMGIDVWEVIAAAATKPFGFQAFYPGTGLGGHCIPIDPYYLTWKAREVGHATRFIELAGEVNRSMPDYVVRRTMLALNQQGKAVKGARVLV